MTLSSKGKDCRHCEEWKPYEEFHDNKEMRDGKSSYCKPCASLRSKMWRESNPIKRKDTELRKKYGISLRDYDAMYAEQCGKCAICGIDEGRTPRQTLFVDHCHLTGRVRGLLCHHCNSGLGHFMDDLNCLKGAISYLQQKERK